MDDIDDTASEWKVFTAINVAVSIGLLVAVADMPYGYYFLLRCAVCFVAVGAAVRRFGLGQKKFGVVLCGIALLFNPLFPVALGKSLWVIVDLGVIPILVASELVPPRGMTVREYLGRGRRIHRYENQGERAFGRGRGRDHAGLQSTIGSRDPDEVENPLQQAMRRRQEYLDGLDPEQREQIERKFRNDLRERLGYDRRESE